MVDLSNDTFTKRLGELTKESLVLSASIISSINQVFYADGVSSTVSDAIDLSVRYVTADDFHKVIAGESGYSFEPSTLYIVSSDQIDAYNTQIVNVADPSVDTDAANKHYVDYKCSTISGGGGPLDGVALLSAENTFQKVQTFKDGFETQSDISVIDHNYIQTTHRSNGEMSRVYNFSPTNSFIQCEEAFPGSNKASGTYGAACTGYKGFCMLWADNTAKTLKLSGELNDELSNEIMWTATHSGCRGWSYIWDNIAVGDKNRISVISIISSDTSSDVKSFTIQCSPDAVLPWLSSETCAIYKWDNGDENGFYFVPPTVEVEQQMLTANGHLSTSIIGNQVIASLYANHAEGGSSKAIGKYAHAEGRRAIAEGRYSHAEGSFTHARDIYSHAEGNTTYANGSAAHAEGNNTKATGDWTHAEGYYSEASAEGAHAEGGSKNNNQKGGLASGVAAHAEGINTTASGEASHAEGIQTSAEKSYSHAEGNRTKATGNQSHAEGYLTEAVGNNSHAEGKSTRAKGLASHAAGISAIASSDYSYVWNGMSATLYDPAKGVGTYCINPENGISGFYVGISSLAQYIGNSSGSSSSGGISSVSASYIDGHIYLSANQQVVGDIDCTNFAKDGRLSSVELCGTQLVFKLTQDAAVNPLSVELSGLSGIGVTEQWVNDQISGMVTKNEDDSLNIELSNGLSSFSINNDNFIQCVLSAILMMDENQISILNEKLGINALNAQIDNILNAS